jgi:hypothetical protein
MSFNIKKRRMKKRYKRMKLCAIFLLALGLKGVQAQTSEPATGGDASGSGGTVSYSIGQIFYTTNTGTNGSVLQGVQLAFEISEVSAIEEAKGINLMVAVYPNPTADYLTLEVKDIDLSSLSYQLYDIKGSLLQNEKIMGNQTNISMCNLVSATYFVKIIKGNKEVKTFKIIKK